MMLVRPLEFHGKKEYLTPAISTSSVLQVTWEPWNMVFMPLMIDFTGLTCTNDLICPDRF